MKKILIPTDLSDLGNYAYDLAHKIGQGAKAEIHLLSIISAPAHAIFDLEGNLKNDEGENFSKLYQEQSERENLLNQWAKNKKDIKFEVVKIGRIEETILLYIVENDIDLVVMGTNGAYGLEQFVAGSHAANLAMKSPAPILSLKCDRSDMAIQDILLACDFHLNKEIDLTMIKSLQAIFSARIHLLKINTPKDFESNRKVLQHMKAFAELNELEQAEYHVYCEESVEQGILNFSMDKGIDFVAMGTHQRSGISQLFRKSISKDLVSHLWQPILTFPL